MGVYAMIYMTKTTVTSTSTTTTTATTTTTTTTTSTSTTTTTTSTTTSTTTTSLPSQCYSYTIVNDITRLTTAGIGTTYDYGLFSTPGWIRFLGTGGTQITTSSPGLYHCTTYYPGWYAGSLPSPSNTISGVMCYVYSTSSCYYSNTISITNCGSFYVYDLVDPPGYYMRYCTV